MPPGRLQEGSEATVMDGRRGPWNLLRDQPDDGERRPTSGDSGWTLLQGELCKFMNFYILNH